jgi:hypothetical protein
MTPASSDFNILYNVNNAHLTQMLGSHMNLITWQLVAFCDFSSFNANPQYMNPAVGDLHINPAVYSPADNSGVPLLNVTDDFDGNPRNPSPDVGADEYTINSPSAFTQISPTNGSSNQPVNGTLSWHASTATGQYLVYLDTLNPPGFVVSQTDTNYSYSGLDTNKTYYWQVHAVNSSGNIQATGSPWSFITGLPSGIVTRSYSMRNGWNMVSVPLVVTDYRKDSLFRTATSKAFTYHSGYVMKDTLDNGVGYWAKFSGAQSVDMTGILCEEDTIDVVHRWNMIGSISSPVPVDSIVQIPNPIVTSVYWGYDGTYQASDTIEPSKSYWVKTNGGGQLVLKKSSSNAQPKHQRKEGQILEQVNTLKIVDANGRLQNLYLGKISLVGSLLDRFELPPPSPSGTFDVRFRSQGCMEGYTLDSKGNTFIIDVKADAYPLALECNIIDDNVKFSLSKGENLSRFALEKGNTITISSPVEQLVIGVYPLTKQAIPKEFALKQNYPNPFNPTTIINYQLPIVSWVTLKVYNILGQEVATLVDGMQDAGFKYIEFSIDGTSRNEKRTMNLSSGVYIYKLMAGEFSQVRKMLLVK